MVVSSARTRERRTLPLRGLYPSQRREVLPELVSEVRVLVSFVFPGHDVIRTIALSVPLAGGHESLVGIAALRRRFLDEQPGDGFVGRYRLAIERWMLPLVTKRGYRVRVQEQIEHLAFLDFRLQIRVHDSDGFKRLARRLAIFIKSDVHPWHKDLSGNDRSNRNMDRIPLCTSLE